LIFDPALSHVAQVQIDRRLDGDVVGLLYRFHGDTFQFEGFVQLACRLGRLHSLKLFFSEAAQERRWRRMFALPGGF